MSFQYESGHEAIDFRAGSVSGREALNSYLIYFSVPYDLKAWRDCYGTIKNTFRDFRARVELGQESVRIGSAMPEFPQVLTANEFGESGVLGFELLLSATKIEKIEEFREGDGIEIKLRITGERVGQQYTVQHDDVLFRINQSQWVDVLKQMNFGTYLLCEVPIELGTDEQLRDVWLAMEKARSLLYNGHFDNAVMECRKALETTIKRVGLVEELSRIITKSRQGHRKLSKRERILYLYEAARRAMHLAAHPDENDEVVTFSRREALLIFSLTAGAIAEITGTGDAWQS